MRPQHRGGISASVLAVIVAASLSALVACQPTDVRTLSADDMAGRDNRTAGSAKARAFLVGRLKQTTASGANPTATGDGAYLQAFAQGTNIVAVVRGTALPDEYVLVGAHYDHLGQACPSTVATDTICNGATDNATGASAVLALADELAEHPPRRSVLLALWDAEEDGMVGSEHYVAHPLVPLSHTIAAVNVDIQGVNLLPSLRNTTFAVSSETGGAALRDLVTGAAQASPLDVSILSNVFGAGASDQSAFIGAGVPSVFLTDSTAGCYHTAQDDDTVVDWDKLEQQRRLLIDLVARVASMAAAPAFVADTPITTFEDVRTLKRIIDRSWVDRAIHGTDDAAEVVEIRAEVTAIYEAGPDAFTGSAVSTFLWAASRSSQILQRDPCNGYLAGT